MYTPGDAGRHSINSRMCYRGWPTATTLTVYRNLAATRIFSCTQEIHHIVLYYLSNRPGRMSALSSDSGKLVAAMTMTPSLGLNLHAAPSRNA